MGVGFLCAAAAFTACDDGSGQTDEFLESQSPKPKIDLNLTSSTLTHTSSQPWLLAKTGSVNPTASTVTWSIAATQGPAGARRLVVGGNINVRNTGAVAAPVGNIVIRLQSKLGSTWTTRSTDIANTTFGDAATAARVVTGNTVTTMNVNSASGSFTVPIAGGLSIPANSTVPLAFTAAFNNDVLGISAGTTVRAEVFVTWGSAGPGNTPTNVDINGNGTVDANEARVDGLSILLGDKVVPAVALTTTPVTLSDTVSDITTTGTATFTNPVFTIGQTTGTVQVSYQGGIEGGTIRNCAHLTGTGINIETCSTQIVPREPWQAGDVITYPQDAWGDIPNGTNTASLLLTNYSTVYPSLQVEVGIPGAGGNSILLTGSSFVLSLLPTNGAIRSLLSDETNLTSTTSGTFGGDVIALQLDVDFSDAGVTLGTLGIPFGNLKLCHVPSLPGLDNVTVRQFLGQVNTLLGGGTATYTINDLSPITYALTNAFVGGAVSAFAVDYLVAGSCN